MSHPVLPGIPPGLTGLTDGKKEGGKKVSWQDCEPGRILWTVVVLDLTTVAEPDGGLEADSVINKLLLNPPGQQQQQQARPGLASVTDCNYYF